MMKLYDDLYIGIPSGIRITGCVIGRLWTTVRANGNIGIARTMEYPDDAEKYAAGFVNKFLRDTAGHINWRNLTDASVGVAAMNAWYNTKEKVEALEALGGSNGRECETIASEALITRELPGLLAAGEKADFALEGVSLPATALFCAFDQPVRELRGYYAKYPETVEACAVKNIADPKPGMTEFKIVF